MTKMAKILLFMNLLVQGCYRGPRIFFKVFWPKRYYFQGFCFENDTFFKVLCEKRYLFQGVKNTKNVEIFFGAAAARRFAALPRTRRPVAEGRRRRLMNLGSGGVLSPPAGSRGSAPENFAFWGLFGAISRPLQAIFLNYILHL